jgi:hypothetical protein
MQNYQSTMESPKLSIDEVITVRQRIQKDVPIPYYYKSESGNYCKVVTKEILVSVDNDSNWWGIKSMPVKHYADQIGKGTEITAEEFEIAYDNALTCVQMLVSDSQPSNERDVNEEIDEIIERRAS